MRKQMLIILTWLVIVGSACTASTGAETTEGKLKVVTTLGQIADAARQVGGEHVEVTGLMGPGVDPHLYVASESDVTLLAEADVIFYNGLFLEAQMEDVLEQIGERKTAVPVGENTPVSQRLASPLYADEFDPHIWFDVTLWQKAVEAVRDTLITADPDNATDYEVNAAAYLDELSALHQYVTETAAQLPPDQRILITAHDAFSYFGRTYGFEVRGLQGISTASEASTADVQALADFIVENEVGAIFVESSVPVRTIEAVQAAVAAQDFTVEIGGQLFSDAMGDKETPAGTYVGMVRYNIETIVGSLLGN